MEMFDFRLKFHWSKFVPKGLINNIPALWLDYRRIYASLGLNELTNTAFSPIGVKEYGVYWRLLHL